MNLSVNRNTQLMSGITQRYVFKDEEFILSKVFISGKGPLILSCHSFCHGPRKNMGCDGGRILKCLLHEAFYGEGTNAIRLKPEPSPSFAG